VNAVLGMIIGGYVVAFLVSRILERSSRRLPKTYDLNTDADAQKARDMMRAAKEPVLWLGAFLIALGVGVISLADDAVRTALGAVLATGTVLAAISGWAWWRTTGTFMQFLRDFRKFAPAK
jgi:Na+/glutamate symporter